jgi:beta-lactam-binding protein with PASTA domain
MKTATVPVVYYKNGVRLIVGEATVDIDDYRGVDVRKAEINLNNAGLSEIRR